MAEDPASGGAEETPPTLLYVEVVTPPRPEMKMSLCLVKCSNNVENLNTALFNILCCPTILLDCCCCAVGGGTGPVTPLMMGTGCAVAGAAPFTTGTESER